MPETTPRLADQLREVRVGVRPDVDVSRHLFGGEPAYVVRDPISFQSHRLSVADYQTFAAISNRQSLGDAFQRLVDDSVLEADQEEEFYRFVISLMQRGLLNLPISNGGRLYQRFEERRRAKRQGWLLNSLFLRVPLLQPDPFLEGTLDFVKPLFTWRAFAVWCACASAALAIVASRWDEITSPLASILTLQNLPLLWTLLVGLKIIHEFGHAYACKRFGGEVPEMGAYLILLTPCAYVDASASWGFTSRWQRIIVALAGIYFESMAAMLALALWAVTPPGAWHDAAHYAVLLSTIVTVAFNANPLMRYDGYYVLSDLVEIPNLRAQADRQLQSGLARWLYGVPPAQAAMPRRRAWGLLLFGLAAAAYKMALLAGIALVIAYKLPLVGVALAGLYVLHALKRSGWALVTYLRLAEELRGRRQRAAWVTAACGAAVIGALSLIPLPMSVQTRAVVAPLREVTVRAEAPGFLRQLMVASGDRVSSGDALCRLENSELVTQLRQLATETEALQVAWKQAVFEDRRASSDIETRLANRKEDYRDLQSRCRALAVCTARDGMVTTLIPDQAGTFLQKGDPIATIGSGPWTLRALLTAEQLVDTQLQPGRLIRYRFFARPEETWTGRVLQVAEQGCRKVERTALTHLAGGTIAVDPRSSETSRPLFEVSIEISAEVAHAVRTGSTAQVLFPAERCTLLGYLCRRGRQLIDDLRMLG